jgi:hypothetical protein
MKQTSVLAQLFPLARLPQHIGAYTALFTFAVTHKNNWLISKEAL